MLTRKDSPRTMPEMDPNFIAHVIKNPMAGQSRAIPAAPLVLSDDQRIRQQQRMVIQSERQKYELETKDRRSLGLPVEPFVSSVELEAAAAAAAVEEEKPEDTKTDTLSVLPEDTKTENVSVLPEVEPKPKRGKKAEKETEPETSNTDAAKAAFERLSAAQAE